MSEMRYFKDILQNKISFVEGVLLWVKISQMGFYFPHFGSIDLVIVVTRYVSDYISPVSISFG